MLKIKGAMMLKEFVNRNDNLGSNGSGETGDGTEDSEETIVVGKGSGGELFELTLDPDQGEDPYEF